MYFVLPVILSSDDEDNASTGSTSRIESISPRPADSACSSPVPSSGKVEAALRENSFIDIKFSNPAEADITIPRKARMKDQVVFLIKIFVFILSFSTDFNLYIFFF